MSCSTLNRHYSRSLFNAGDRSSTDSINIIFEWEVNHDGEENSYPVRPWRAADRSIDHVQASSFAALNKNWRYIRIVCKCFNYLNDEWCNRTYTITCEKFKHLKVLNRHKNFKISQSCARSWNQCLEIAPYWNGASKSWGNKFTRMRYKSFFIVNGSVDHCLFNREDMSHCAF